MIVAERRWQIFLAWEVLLVDASWWVHREVAGSGRGLGVEALARSFFVDPAAQRHR